MDPDPKLIQGCLDKDPKAQEAIYRLYAPIMYGVCLRYARNHMEAEDILQDGFIKVFMFLKDYRHEGSFGGWVHRTFINTAINYYRLKAKELADLSLDKLEFTASVDENIIDTISTNELLGLIQELPEGYRMVFNLSIIEGYSHKEIASMLNIKESTSKSQLSRARGVLQNKILQLKTNRK